MLALDSYSYSAKGPWKKSLNFIFPTKYVIFKKFKGWPLAESVFAPIMTLPSDGDILPIVGGRPLKAIIDMPREVSQRSKNTMERWDVLLVLS